MKFDLSKAFFAGLGGTVAIVLIVLMTGQTFGQRCRAAYTDPAQIEDCVLRLKDGGRVYGTPAAIALARGEGDCHE